jgi:hypothetical protein
VGSPVHERRTGCTGGRDQEHRSRTIRPGDAPSHDESWKLPDTSLRSADNGNRASLDSLSKEERYAKAQERGVEGRSEMTKQQLVQELRRD